MLSQRRLLLSGRSKPISRHIRNVATTTDKSPKGEAAFTALAKAGELDAATTL
jgi:hypothetical protein